MSLQRGPLFRVDWAFSFYGLLALSIIVSFGLNHQLSIKRLFAFSSAGYVCAVMLLFVTFLFFRNSHLDIRTYLAGDTTKILHKYDTVDNHWDDAFLDPTGHAYYENVTSEDIAKLLALNSEEIWNNRIAKDDFASRAQWRYLSSNELDYADQHHKKKISHPDTLCSFATGALCVNETTGQVLFSYW